MSSQKGAGFSGLFMSEKAPSLPRAAWRSVAPVALTFASLFSSAPASAAALEGPIEGWQQGTEPQWVSMYVYVPDDVAPGAPLLTIVHFCGGSAAVVFGQALDGGMVEAADEHGFILVLPQTSRNCWDVATEPALTHGSASDTRAIVSQVE